VQRVVSADQKPGYSWDGQGDQLAEARALAAELDHNHAPEPGGLQEIGTCRKCGLLIARDARGVWSHRPSIGGTDAGEAWIDRNPSGGRDRTTPSHAGADAHRPIESQPEGNLMKRGAVMNIGIIGAGAIGGTLARRFVALGHHVAVANSRDPETIGPSAADWGATAAWASEAAHGADVVVVAVPEKDAPDLPDSFLKGAADDVVVIDTGNYYPQERDGRIEEIESGMTESRWVEEQIGVSVVKAFNTMPALHLVELARAQGASGRVALPVAGDDTQAKAIVMDLVNALGFDPVDGGGLDDSWRQQPGSPVYGGELDAAGIRHALAEAVPGRSAPFRA
jgi:predicted dinucleotide-binding enzyme